MKIRQVSLNSRKRAFEVKTSSRTLMYPYSKADPRPTRADRVAEAAVDAELGREGFTYVLESGREGTVHRRLGTSAAQLYRLLDQTNYRKSVDQMLLLPSVLDCEVALVIRAKTA